MFAHNNYFALRNHATTFILHSAQQISARYDIEIVRALSNTCTHYTSALMHIEIDMVKPALQFAHDKRPLNTRCDDRLLFVWQYYAYSDANFHSICLSYTWSNNITDVLLRVMSYDGIHNAGRLVHTQTCISNMHTVLAFTFTHSVRWQHTSECVDFGLGTHIIHVQRERVRAKAYLIDQMQMVLLMWIPFHLILKQHHTN